MVLLAFQQ